ncbi:MAG TPA: hypothetical protein VGR73_07240 [Bryobacteraceae bacterium]|nr:hypothetical protein [Bryobacteraceae bacterium]
MTIDERLDRLALRHEALTQSIELMIHDHREAFAKYDATLAKHADFLAEHDAVMAKHDATLAKHADFLAEHDAVMAKTQVMLAEVVESIDSLARIAHLHERRISNLEEGRA